MKLLCAVTNLSDLKLDLLSQNFNLSPTCQYSIKSSHGFLNMLKKYFDSILQMNGTI